MGTATNIGAGAARLIGPAAMLLAAVAACPALAVTKGKPVAARHLPGATVTLDTDGTGDRLRTGSLSSFAPDVVDSGKFSFTAPGSTPANARLATTERAFRFTPSGKVDNRRAFSVGVTSRVVAAAPDTTRAAAVPVEVAQANPDPAGGVQCRPRGRLAQLRGLGRLRPQRDGVGAAAGAGPVAAAAA